MQGVCLQAVICQCMHVPEQPRLRLDSHGSEHSKGQEEGAKDSGQQLGTGSHNTLRLFTCSCSTQLLRRQLELEPDPSRHQGSLSADRRGAP